MTPIQINLHTPVYGYKAFNEKDIKEIIESDGELLIKLAGGDCYNIYPGDKLIFKRYIYENDGTYFTLTDYVEVLSEDKDHTIHTTVPSARRIALYPNDVKHVSGYTEDNNLYTYHILKCREDHNIFPQDLVGQSVIIKDYEGTVLGTYDDISIPLKRSDKAATSADCLTFIEKQESCGKNSNKINVYEYNFLPEKISRNCIIINGFEESGATEMVYLETKFNPFYRYYIEANENGKPIKHCILYGDSWWETILESDRKDIKINNYGNTRTEIGINSAYWNTNVGFSAESNETQMGSYDDLSTSFVKDIEKSLVPDVIDMERVKYSPMIYDSGVGIFNIATSITFDFHFRERKKIESDEERLKNTSITSGNVYCDGWYINPDSADSVWWNGMEYSESAFSNTVFSDFIGASGETSDLLGYLNFTDNDVFYRKKKVSKTFIRLLFYNSKDPIEQKLLYYSTIFLDGTKLYSKYLKQLMYMEDNDLFDEKKNNLNTVVVSYSGGTRVDSEIVVTNEFDRTKSAEGFNIYLFAEDTNFGLDENGEKTIYMKVEFNHAGNGKTIPMISWPKNDKGDYVSLTIDNFIENLYIPIKIGYTNDRYIYYIPNAYKNENGDIKLVLFEPKLDFNEKKDAVEENNGAN